MLENYFKIAWRNLVKRKFFSLVSILGLSAGMTFTFLIGSYVWGELQVNTSLKKPDNQYILQSKWKQPDMGVEIATLGPLGKTLKEEYPNLVANYYRYDGITVAVSNGEKHFREDVQAGDSTLLSMYGFPLIYGDPRTALQQPNSIALTEEKAVKYFGTNDVLGKNITLDNFVGGKQEFRITAVLKTLPNNSVTNLLKLPAEIFIPLKGLNGRNGSDSWSFPYMITFIELKKDVTTKDLEKPITRILNTNATENDKANLQVYLTPLKEFYMEQNNGLVRKMIYTLLGVSVFILIMAVVNFVNISIGNSSSRLKEIGVRKVLGSMRKQLIFQFLAESFILTFVSMLFSIGFYELFRPYFENMLGKNINSVFSLLPYSLIIIVFITAITALLAGIYPAFILSSLPAIESVKGKLKSVKENILFRRVLIGAQFSIALFVFIAATLVAGQVSYFFSKDLGYNKESIISIATPRDWTPEGLIKMEGIREEMARLKEVDQVSLSYEIPNGNFGGNTGLYKIGQDSTQAIYTQILSTDEKYADTYQLSILAGKFFYAKQGVYRPDEIVLNEEAAKSLGFMNPQDAVGQQVRMHFSSTPLTIGGIVKNFHFESMHKEIKPLAFLHIRNANIYRFLSFKIPAGNISQSVVAIENKWRTLMPETAFEYSFMDDTLAKLYKSEMQLKRAANVAAILSVIIVLLGILGMVSMNVARRTREVGIRKVLGASFASVTMLFLKEFLMIILAAMLTAFPLAFFSMNKWLQNYAYRVEIGWASFASVGFIFSLVVCILVGLVTYKAAVMNPVKAIRTD
ncbi:ABC transporter permease [Dyadobacter frigoris]|uniref:FtsX-like permease family protein n=1 Tax=Dyadobacter frigoris TaxID=2576211 RepID=A0A4U6D7F9_9BACT|nr:ABC transporter permease [Dyadobacter frigoris]TKT92445.1 FtsX-like permease family protein [Dyadobacter frigoris]GLU53638.1 ABC transporter permease [Dyadobacter frigoris]